jgi:glycosyltransferase involved in cell wall biosynthesis
MGEIIANDGMGTLSFRRAKSELCSEPELANGWAVASSYTARTLAQHGIPAEKIHVVPYGVDSGVFAKRVRPPSRLRPLTAIFVGSLVQRKGLAYFLEAARMLGSRSMRIKLCGRGRIHPELLAHYSDLDLT